MTLAKFITTTRKSTPSTEATKLERGKKLCTMEEAFSDDKKRGKMFLLCTSKSQHGNKCGNDCLLKLSNVAMNMRSDFLDLLCL